MNESDFQRMRELCARLAEAVDHAEEQLARIDRKLELLQGRTCNGSISWRDPRTDAPKMYVIHGVGETCPLHGPPAGPDGRTRTYIGTKRRRQRSALAAIRAHSRLVLLKRERDALAAALNTRPIAEVVARLGLDPSTGEPLKRY